MNSLGSKIRQLRKERKLTQWQLADGLVTASMISQIESDKATPSQQLLEQLSVRLGVKPSYFADDISHKSDLMQTYRRAKQALESENFAVALPLLESLTCPVPPLFRESSMFSDLAHCYERLGLFEKAVSTYEEVVRAAHEKEDIPTAIQAYYRLGQLERRQLHTGLARMHWQRATELMRRYPDISMPISMKLYANLARAHVQFYDYTQAIDCYRKAAVLAEKYNAQLDLAITLHGLGSVELELGRFDEGLDTMKQAINLYDAIRHQRGINQCHINIGVGLRKIGKLQESINHLTWCIQDREIQIDILRLANAHCERAISYLMSESHEFAIQDALETTVLDRENAELQSTAYKILAESYLVLGQAKRALHAAECGLESAVRVENPQLQIDLYALRAKAHTILGNHEEALQDAVTIAERALALV